MNHNLTLGDGSDGDPESYHKKLLVTRARSDRTHPSNVFSEPDIYQDTSGVSKANVVRGVGVAYQIIADETWQSTAWTLYPSDRRELFRGMQFS